MRMLRHLAMLLVVLGLAHTVWGQAGVTGTILGTVTDFDRRGRIWRSG